jgi:hypothetical protein
MVPEVAQALKQRGISPPSRSSIAGSCYRWTDGLLAGSAYIGQIVHEYGQWRKLFMSARTDGVIADRTDGVHGLLWRSSWSALA